MKIGDWRIDGGNSSRVFYISIGWVDCIHMHIEQHAPSLRQKADGFPVVDLQNAAARILVGLKERKRNEIAFGWMNTRRASLFLSRLADGQLQT